MAINSNTYYILASSQLFPFVESSAQLSKKNQALAWAIQAYEFVKSNNYEDAINLYNKAILDYPEQPFFYACRSIMHNFNGDDESAYYDYQIAKKYDFNYHHFIEWLENAGNMVEANELLELNEAIVNDIENVQLYINRALIQVQHFNYSEAISDYSKAFAISGNTEILLSRAAIYMRTLQYDKALDDLNIVLEEKEVSDAYMYRAKLFTSIKDFESALVDLNSAISRDSNNINVYEERANLYEQIGEFSKAVDDYTSIIQISSEDFFPYVMRADMFERLEDWNKAILDYNKAIELNPYYSDLYQYRGDLKLKLGDMKGAESDFQKFKELEESE